MDMTVELLADTHVVVEEALEEEPRISELRRIRVQLAVLSALLDPVRWLLRIYVFEGVRVEQDWLARVADYAEVVCLDSEHSIDVTDRQLRVRLRPATLQLDLHTAASLILVALSSNLAWYPTRMARSEEHLEALLKMPVEDRAHAAKRLLESLEGDVDADAEDAWAAEIERRLARIQSGEATLVSAADAAARIQRAARGR
jgi:hypothetical protein